MITLLVQELLPDHLLKEAKVAADKSKGTGVQWPFGWGKKKGQKELEALPTPEAEVLKVWPMPCTNALYQCLVHLATASRNRFLNT